MLLQTHWKDHGIYAGETITGMQIERPYTKKYIGIHATIDTS